MVVIPHQYTRKASRSSLFFSHLVGSGEPEERHAADQRGVGGFEQREPRFAVLLGSGQDRRLLVERGDGLGDLVDLLGDERGARLLGGAADGFRETRDRYGQA